MIWIGRMRDRWEPNKTELTKYVKYKLKEMRGSLRSRLIQIYARTPIRRPSLERLRANEKYNQYTQNWAKHQVWHTNCLIDMNMRSSNTANNNHNTTAEQFGTTKIAPGICCYWCTMNPVWLVKRERAHRVVRSSSNRHSFRSYAMPFCRVFFSIFVRSSHFRRSAINDLTVCIHTHMNGTELTK